MVLIKIAIVAAGIAGLLALAQNQRWFERAGLLSECHISQAPLGSQQRGGQWWACTAGVVSGYPNLTRDHCDRRGGYGQTELWYCPVARAA